MFNNIFLYLTIYAEAVNFWTQKRIKNLQFPLIDNLLLMECLILDKEIRNRYVT